MLQLIVSINNDFILKFILAEELYAKALQIFEICLPFINNLCGKADT